LSRIKRLLLASTLALAAAGLAACFGGGSGVDLQKLIDQTFSGNKTVNSGKLGVSLKVRATGSQGGSFEVTLTGPFEGKGKRVPRFDLTASLSGSGGGQNLSFTGGLLSTGDAAFVSYQGTDYQVDPNTFNQFKSQYESQAAASKRKSNANPFGKLGIKPRNWLTNLKDEGTETVGGAETIHVSGDADIGRVIGDFKKLLGAAGRLGLPAGARLPDAGQLDQARKAVKEAHFDIYSGKSDKILRKLEASLKIEPPAGSGPSSVDVDFSITLSDLNKPQTVKAPSGAKPLSDLLGKLGIGALGGISGGGGGSIGGAGGTPGGAPGNTKSQQYLECLQKAQGQAAIQDCASVLQ
jgi:hypothetical protein